MLHQEINLYLPEFRRKQHWLDAARGLKLFIAFVALLVLVAGWEYWQVLGLREQLAGLDRARQQAVAATAALRASYGEQSEDQELLESNRQLEEALQAKEALLSFLEGRDLGNAAGFSEHLADLSRYHIQGLSLESIRLAAGGTSVLLAGRVVQAELVPRYLQNLSRGQSFAGKSFETLQIRDSEPSTEGASVPAWLFEVKTLEE